VAREAMKIALAEFVWQRARDRCEYCRMPQTCDEVPFEIDHVIAEQHGGKTITSNLALACFADNHHKGPNLSGIDPKTRKRTCARKMALPLLSNIAPG